MYDMVKKVVSPARSSVVNLVFRISKSCMPQLMDIVKVVAVACSYMPRAFETKDASEGRRSNKNIESFN